MDMGSRMHALSFKISFINKRWVDHFFLLLLLNMLCKKRIVLKRSVPYQPLVEPLKKTKKSVSFGEPLEEVVYFHKTQPPRAIQEDLIVASDHRLTKPNWTKPTLFGEKGKIRMEQAKLVDGDYELAKKNQLLMEGQCRAMNLSYQKLVSVRYTFDLWHSYQEVTGEFKESIPSTTWDRFSFSIPIQTKDVPQTIHLALRYSVNGQEYWDNNSGLNYKIVITPPTTKQKPLLPKPLLSKRYDLDSSLISPPPSPPITTPPIEYTLPIQKESLTQMSYTDFVNKYCFYNSPTPIYSTSALFT
ncbi:unnamed protein product [Rhizopus stolonifer]